jgi:hypothetical protein
MPFDSPFKNLDRHRLVHPPEAIASFIRKLTVRKYGGEEKRGKPRYHVTIPLIVQPLDEVLKRVGEPFLALTRDRVVAGLLTSPDRATRLLWPVSGRLRTEPLPATAGLNESAGDLRSSPVPRSGDRDTTMLKMQVLIEIRRCFPIHGALYELGGKFVMRLDSDPPAPPAPGE